MTEYKISLKWRVFLIAFGCGAFILGGAVLSDLPEKAETFSSASLVGNIIIIGLFFLAGLSAILASVRHCVWVYSDYFVVRNAYSTRTVRVNEMRGYKNRSVFCPCDKSKRKLYFDFTMLENRKDFDLWIQANFTDLLRNDEPARVAADVEEVIHDSSLGESIDAKNELYVKAYYFNVRMSLCVTILSLWAFIFPAPYIPLLATLVLLPWLIVIALIRYKGILRFSEKSKVYVNMDHPFLAIPLVLLFRAYWDWDYIDLTEFIVPSISIGLALFLFMLFVTYKLKSKMELPLFFVLCILYGAGTTAFISSSIETDPPQIFKCELLGKVKVNRWNTALDVLHFDGKKEPYRLKVPHEIAKTYSIEDEVVIKVYFGYFGLRRYEVHKKHTPKKDNPAAAKNNILLSALNRSRLATG